MRLIVAYTVQGASRKTQTGKARSVEAPKLPGTRANRKPRAAPLFVHFHGHDLGVNDSMVIIDQQQQQQLHMTLPQHGLQDRSKLAPSKPSRPLPLSGSLRKETPGASDREREESESASMRNRDMMSTIQYVAHVPIKIISTNIMARLQYVSRHATM